MYKGLREKMIFVKQGRDWLDIDGCLNFEFYNPDGIHLNERGNEDP